MTKNDLIINIDKIHTTVMGIDRIKRNLGLNDDIDEVKWCKEQILAAKSVIREGKNWYIETNNTVITVNAYSYTVITAHKLK